MTQAEFFQEIQKYDSLITPASPVGKITIININLQKIRAAMLPEFMINLYKECNCIKLGTGYIFGVSEFSRNNKHPVPNIFEVNDELTNLPKMRGKTVFGRNDLFWFVFDSFGRCFMMDTLELNVLREYTDPYRAMLDCLLGGKF